MKSLEPVERIRARLSSRKRKAISREGLSPAAVALLLTPRQEELEVVFTLRTKNVLHHKGEISFPGGKADTCDLSPFDTALRETWEEIGVRPEAIDVLGALDDQVSFSGFLVTPVVALLPVEDYPFVPAPAEVSEVFTVPIPHLTGKASHFKRINSRHPDDVYSFGWREKVIWGLTASILHSFLTVAFDYEFGG